ncbi:IS200/IS605 family transposase [Membranihabitans maritimus]|uniref:IS200/IS605 family transposase n=1 Tax=Membranihabitans maritimus TaxID=2904244 RepID=UPI001F018245|nr:IS200/IS605 family transposase [Membranihabitans maritimus]
MANTYTQIHIQAVFAVQNRQSLIKDKWEENLYKVITTILQKHGHKMLQINGMPDHVHILFGMRPNQSISDLIKYVKQRSSAWINNDGLTRGKFSWQEGYGAFSYSKIQLPQVIRYIKLQKEHHRKKSFQEEYLELLDEWEIEYDDRYVFKTLS